MHTFVCVSVFVPPDREFFAYSHKVGRGRAMHAVALELGFLLLFFLALPELKIAKIYSPITTSKGTEELFKSGSPGIMC